MADSFTALRAQLRDLESGFEKAINEYSVLAHPQSSASRNNNTTNSVDLERKLSEQIEELLDKRAVLIDRLAQSIESDDLRQNFQGGAGGHNNTNHIPNSSARRHHLSRAREVLADHKRDFHRIKARIEHTRESENLLSSIQRDISEYKTAHQSSAGEVGRNGNGGNSRLAESYLLQERSHIDNSHNMTDALIAQANATRDEFSRQAHNLTQINRRLLASASQLPGINTLVSKINTRKKRDSIIMATLISTCIVGLYFFM